MNLPNYYDNFRLGCSSYLDHVYCHGSGHRAVISADYGIVWQATKKVSLSIRSITPVSISPEGPPTPARPLFRRLHRCGGNNGFETINYSGR